MNEHRAKFHWKLNFLLLHPSGERFGRFPRSVIPNSEDWTATVECLKLFTVDCLDCTKTSSDMTPCKQTPSDNFSFHLPLCLSILHTWRRLSSLSAVLIWSRWVQTGLCQVYLESPDSSGWFWSDVMRCYPLLFYSSFRCASRCCATATPPLAHVIAQHQVNLHCSEHALKELCNLT